MAERGVFVFPIRGKHPATEHGFKDATSDPGAARALFRERYATGIGIDCGRSRLLVVDLDGPAGAEAWHVLHTSRGGCPETLAADTGRHDGGRHLYFRTAGTPPRSRRLAVKLDTRGDGGYVISPPSLHPSGRRYTWANGCRPALAPEWLLKELTPPAITVTVGERRSLPPGLRLTSYGRRAIEGLADEMLGALEGSRNDTLLAVARRAGRLEAAGELDAGLAERVLTEAACAVGLCPREVELTFASGFGFGRQYPARRAPR
jgi:hypothetical protein